MDLSVVRDIAIDIVTQARAGILAHVEAGFSFEKKSDNSFVTTADLDAERLIRQRLAEHFPDHGILGEEFEASASTSGYTWVIDPIDGTHSFRHGIPLYGTMLALLEGDTPVVSVIDLAGIGRLYAAAKGLGSTRNGRPIRLHPLGSARIEDEVIALGERKQFVSCGLERVYDTLMTGHDHARTYCDCFGHALAAEGSVGAMVDYNIRIWDSVASVLLVEEAGGKTICLGERQDGAEKRYDWVFGKPEVVEWVRLAISD
ncbi:MAG: inositol monophosphatase family protein [Rhodothermales bacterium]|nr:inositol monophosphatase family protein [Rhodothermales bacterium]